MNFIIPKKKNPHSDQSDFTRFASVSPYMFTCLLSVKNSLLPTCPLFFSTYYIYYFFTFLNSLKKKVGKWAESPFLAKFTRKIADFSCPLLFLKVGNCPLFLGFLHFRHHPETPKPKIKVGRNPFLAAKVGRKITVPTTFLKPLKLLKNDLFRLLRY